VLAFAGHGLQFQGAADAYFCPADARPFADEAATMVSVSQVYRELEKSFAGVKVLFVDACRNDPDPGRGRGVDGDNSPPPPKGVAALFSCSAGEKAYEHRELRHGVFFHSVLDGLRGKASDGDGKVTWDALQAHVCSQVPELMKTHLPDRAQQPNLKADLVGSPPALLRVVAAAPGRSVTNSIGMKLVRIDAGEFQMGSPDEDAEADADEKPPHAVRITKAFFLGVHEVTRGQFAKFVEESGYSGAGHWRDPGFAQTDAHPVVNVTWNDAVACCEWLSKKESVVYRLPTEAEWEYACRAGTTSVYPEGNDPTSLAKFGNVKGSGDGYENTAPAGSFLPNAWGLYDMHGNVWEWCSDGYDENYYKVSPRDDPPGAAGASARVSRGGSWSTFPRCRAASRRAKSPSDQDTFLGFRVARVP
jgi:formylglycine-generating enzyme required for sulfatase activity